MTFSFQSGMHPQKTDMVMWILIWILVKGVEKGNKVSHDFCKKKLFVKLVKVELKTPYSISCSYLFVLFSIGVDVGPLSCGVPCSIMGQFISYILLCV